MESGGGVNSRAITGATMSCDMHVLTRESQEVMAGTLNVLTTLNSNSDEAVLSLIVWTDISHSGQLNITNSTLLTLKRLDAIPVKSKVNISLCNVSN